MPPRCCTPRRPSSWSNGSATSTCSDWCCSGRTSTQGDPGEGRVLGADQLLAFGGDGTPLVQELCWAELAIARQAGVVATQRLAADALDLRHRLSLLWEAVQHLKVPVWVARKVAGMSRELSKDAVGLVDAAVGAAVDQSPGRILAIAEAKLPRRCRQRVG